MKKNAATSRGRACGMARLAAACAISSIALTSCVATSLPGTNVGVLADLHSAPQQTVVPESKVEILRFTAKALKNVNVRSGPGTDSAKLYLLKADGKVEILEEKDNWYHIRNLDNRSLETGWVRFDFLVVDSADRHPLMVQAFKKVNMRSGPGRSHKVVTQVRKGASLTASGLDGRWYKVRDGEKAGWIRNDFVVMDIAASRTSLVPADGDGDSSSLFNRAGLDKAEWNKLATTAVMGQVLPLERRVAYEGYSADFQPIKTEMLSGNLERTYEALEERDRDARNDNGTEKEFAEEVGVLALLERGSLLVDIGEFDKARQYLTYAEEILKQRDQRSKTADFGQVALSTAASFAGFGDASEYQPTGFERVLMLNFKAMAFLLEGRRQAFNVTLRAIDLQNEERKRFSKLVEEAKKGLEKENASDQAGQAIRENFGKIYEGHNKAGDAKAETVENAYVNPFGDYISGLVWEFDGYRDEDQLDNAAKSYRKASKLKPSVKFLEKAISDAENRKLHIDDGRKIVHVVVADGVAPERKTMTFGLPAMDNVVPVKVPVYEQVDNTVQAIKVKTGGNEQLLETLADVEAIAMRYDRDSRPLQFLNMAVNVVRAFVEKQALNQLGAVGSMVSNVRESISNPDMRAWMTLPATFKVTRFSVPADASEVTLTTYGKDGKKLISKKTALSSGGPTIVYGRSLNGALVLHSSTKTWVEE